MDEMALFTRFILQENLIMINNSEFINLMAKEEIPRKIVPLVLY